MLLPDCVGENGTGSRPDLHIRTTIKSTDSKMSFSVFSPEQKTAQVFCAPGLNRFPAGILWRGFYLLCGAKHMSAGRLVTCSAAHVYAEIFYSVRSLPFADGTEFACNCAQVQQKWSCRPMFFARLPNFVVPVHSITFGLHFQRMPCHVLTVPPFVLSHMEESD